MADDAHPNPNQETSAMPPDASGLNPSPEPEQVSKPAVNKSRRRFLPKLGSLSFYRIDRHLKLTVSIILRTSIVVGVVFIAVYIYRELSDKSYHVQAFEMPEDLVSQGYNGKVMAYHLQDEMKRIVNIARLTWSPKEIAEYNQSTDNIQIQAEVGGIAFSPATIIRYFKQVLGIPDRSISSEIARNGNKLKLTVRISGTEGVNIGGVPGSFVLERLVGDSAPNALDELIKKEADAIVRGNNPLLLAFFYTSMFSDDRSVMNRTLLKNRDSLAVEMYRSAIAFKSTQAADAYAWWGALILKNGNDSAKALSKLRRALKIDPNNAVAYRFWGTIKFSNGDFKEGEKLLRKSLDLDPTSAAAWSYLGLRYLQKKGERDRDAENCFREASTLDPNNLYTFYLCLVLWIEEKYDEAAIQKDHAHITPFDMEIAIAEGLRDTANAVELFNEAKKVNPRYLSNDLNSLAFNLEGRKMHEKQAFRYIRMAIKADSTSALPYTTLAELYGIKGDESNFYLSLERALKLGLDVKDLDTQDEPYKSLAEQNRYKELKIKYSKKE